MTLLHAKILTVIAKLVIKGRVKSQNYSINKGEKSNESNLKSKEHTKSTILKHLEVDSYQVANTAAYPDLILEKFIGIYSSEDLTAFIHLLEKKKGLLLRQ